VHASRFPARFFLTLNHIHTSLPLLPSIQSPNLSSLPMVGVASPSLHAVALSARTQTGTLSRSALHFSMREVSATLAIALVSLWGFPTMAAPPLGSAWACRLLCRRRRSSWARWEQAEFQEEKEVELCVFFKTIRSKCDIKICYNKSKNELNQRDWASSFSSSCDIVRFGPSCFHSLYSPPPPNSSFIFSLFVFLLSRSSQPCSIRIVHACLN